MAEYIKREDAVNSICIEVEKQRGNPKNKLHLIDIPIVVQAIQAIPAADVVEVVRCQDCKHAAFPGKANPLCNLYYGLGHYNGFCSEGERREGGDVDA